MKDLIEALEIFVKYSDQQWPTVCEHDVLYIVNDNDAHTYIEHADRERLRALGFFWDTDVRCWASFRFGSA
jgi:hypothetical protein